MKDFYLGSKLVQAQKMSRKTFQETHNREIYTDNPIREDEEGYEVAYPGGYISWTPAYAFEPVYKPAQLGEFKEGDELIIMSSVACSQPMTRKEFIEAECQDLSPEDEDKGFKIVSPSAIYWLPENLFNDLQRDMTVAEIEMIVEPEAV